MTLTDRFIHQVMAFSEREFAPEVIRHLQKTYLDYLGCVLAGASLNREKTGALLRGGLLNAGPCSVFGGKETLSVRDAGFVNGFNAHSLEMDDGHRYAMLHIQAPVFSAMTALYQQENLTAEDFYRGVLVGYETTIRVARALQPSHKVRGFHSTGTCGTVGVAMAAAAALHFSFDQFKSTLTAAASGAAGLLEILSGNSELKPFNVARAVSDGLTAAYVGRNPYESPEDILGGKRGFLAVMTDTPHPEFLETFNPADAPMILGNFFKPYPACRHCHSTIDAALDIARNQKVPVSEIRQVRIGTYKLALTGHDHVDVSSPKSAMMSIPYGAVVALVRKSADLADYRLEVVFSKEIQVLLGKVRIGEDPEMTALLPDIRGAVVEVETCDRTYRSRVDYSLGEPENPMDEEAIGRKFYALAAYAGLPKAKADEMVDAVYGGKVVLNG